MDAYLKVLKKTTRDLHPDYFAMIMATGIVSIAFKEMGFALLGDGLFILNIVGYFILLLFLAGRALFFWPQVMADLRVPQRAWPFLTFVVGTNTIGAQLILFSHMAFPALLLWIVATVSWVGCVYFILFNIVTRTEKSITDSINGGTLLIVVSTESIAILGVRLLEVMDIHGGGMLFMVWTLWAAGFALYFLIMPLVMYRIFFCPMAMKDWHGPYWISMGAVAIIALTGAEMVVHIPDGPLWEDVHGTTKALTLIAWALATWWIPYQIIMDVWKLGRVHIAGVPPLWVRLFPWARLAFGRGKNHFFDPPCWGRVFPMGMYAACTLTLAGATGFHFLNIVPQYWIWFAFAVWAMTYAGTMRVAWKGLLTAGRAVEADLMPAQASSSQEKQI